jgi:excisionase family DNA binding protein
MAETLLKVPAVAERLNLSRSATYELISRRELRSVSIGRARRVPESEIDRFIAIRMAESDRSAA